MGDERESEPGHWYSTNLVGIPAPLLASSAFNAHPQSLRIAGARECSAGLFALLERCRDADQASEIFEHYMSLVFGLAKPAGGAAARPESRRWRASYLKLLQGWGLDANGPAGAVLKGWVESRFGIFPTFHKEIIRRISSGAWTTYVEEKMSSRFHNNAIYTQLDLLFEFCQWALEQLFAPGETHITLYRGINSFDEHKILRQIDKRTVVMRLNNLTSFSSDRDIADCFGDTILTVRVPVAKVAFFNSLLSTHPLKGEGEYLVVGGEYQLTASYF